jgi:hypothetical protein
VRSVNLEKWRGKRDAEAIDPAQVEFAALKRASCTGCAFEFQWSTTCEKAHQEAVKRSLPPCSDGFIFVQSIKDKRQKSLPGIESV